VITEAVTVEVADVVHVASVTIVVIITTAVTCIIIIITNIVAITVTIIIIIIASTTTTTMTALKIANTTASIMDVTAHADAELVLELPEVPEVLSLSENVDRETPNISISYPTALLQLSSKDPVPFHCVFRKDVNIICLFTLIFTHQTGITTTRAL